MRYDPAFSCSPSPTPTVHRSARMTPSPIFARPMSESWASRSPSPSRSSTSWNSNVHSSRRSLTPAFGLSSWNEESKYKESKAVDSMLFGFSFKVFGTGLVGIVLILFLVGTPKVDHLLPSLATYYLENEGNESSKSLNGSRLLHSVFLHLGHTGPGLQAAVYKANTSNSDATQQVEIMSNIANSDAIQEVNIAFKYKQAENMSETTNITDEVVNAEVISLHLIRIWVGLNSYFFFKAHGIAEIHTICALSNPPNEHGIHFLNSSGLLAKSPSWWENDYSG